MTDTAKMFREVLTTLDAVVEECSWKEVAGRLVSMARDEDWNAIALGADEILKDQSLVDSLRMADLEVVLPPDATSDIGTGRSWRDRVAQTDAGLTGCVGAAAETGSALMRPHRPDVRSVSLLPPLHIILVELSRLHPDIGSLMESWVEEGAEGNAVFVTGPSRTADIEKELVLGVHGPSRVHVFLISDR